LRPDVRKGGKKKKRTINPRRKGRKIKAFKGGTMCGGQEN